MGHPKFRSHPSDKNKNVERMGHPSVVVRKHGEKRLQTWAPGRVEIEKKQGARLHLRSCCQRRITEG